jgi:hypothetical protein
MVLHRSTLALELDRTDADQVAGRFHYATLLRNRPEVLATWRIASNLPLVLDHIAEQLGGSPRHVGGDTWSVTTTSIAVDILLTDPGALRLRWHRDARHSCDGRTQCRYTTQRPCACPSTLEERRMATRQGRGCEPQVDMLFRLLQDPTLGAFCFTSGRWSFAEVIHTRQRPKDFLHQADGDRPRAAARARSSTLVGNCRRLTQARVIRPRHTHSMSNAGVPGDPL